MLKVRGVGTGHSTSARRVRASGLERCSKTERSKSPLEVGGYKLKLRPVGIVVCFSPATFSHLSADLIRAVFCHISKMERERQGNCRYIPAESVQLLG